MRAEAEGVPYQWSFRVDPGKSQSPVLHQVTRWLTHIRSHELETTEKDIEMERHRIALTAEKSLDTVLSLSPRTSRKSSTPTPTVDPRRYSVSQEGAAANRTFFLLSPLPLSLLFDKCFLARVILAHLRALLEEKKMDL